MVFFNYALRKLNAKIVYYGPGLCGKTTNLQWVHDNFEGGDKGKMVSLATEGDRTIFFDLLPLDIGKIRGMDVTLQLYTVPGQVHYNSTRQLVLRGADGVVFVADSQRAMQSSNIDSLKNLDENLGLQGINLADFPHVIQFNKRDLGELMGLEEMDAALNRYDAPFFESVAVEGIGVQETLEGIVRLVMRSLKGRYESHGLGAEPSRLKPAGVPGSLPGPVETIPPSPVETTASPSMDIPTIGGAFDAGDTDSEALSGVATFDIEREPETVSLETPVSTDWDQPVSGEPSDASAGLEPTEGSPDSERNSVFPSMPEAPEPDIGPPVGDDAEVFEGLEPVPFEEIDTQTGMLVPPPEAEAPEGFGADPADLLPEGPGKPFPSDEETVSVAEYDTADVGEFPSPSGESGEGDSDEMPVENFHSGEGESQGDDLSNAASLIERELLSEEKGQVASESVSGQRVKDLFAAVLGSQRDSISDEAEPSGAIDQPEGERSETDISDQAAGLEPDIFEPEALQGVENTEDPFTESAAGDPGIGEVYPLADPDDHTIGQEPPLAADDDDSEPFSQPSVPTPVVFDDGDPFVSTGWEEPTPGPPASAGVLVMDEASALPVEVSAEDNSLALKLSGTGAIVESGQVRALDIEVPVPGTWVGNRKVTLQLRLTLSPVSEDENDGTNNPA